MLSTAARSLLLGFGFIDRNRASVNGRSIDFLNCLLRLGATRHLDKTKTGQSKGFGFVEMSSNAEAQKAIQEINGSTIDGREVKVNEAKPQEKRSGGGGRW